MATTGTTTNNAFSTSTSPFRASQSQAGPPTTLSDLDSSLTQLPTIDFNFDDLRKRMSEFTVKFDTFIKRGQERVLEERNEFRGRLGEITEERRSTNAQITSLQSTIQTHNTLLSREQSEKDEIHAQITSLQARQTQQTAHRDRLRAAIAQTQRQIDAKLAAQREYAEKVDNQARLNGPELNFWETYLGCRIEGAGDECLVRVVFTFPPATSASNKEEREASFELRVPETGAGGYQVVHARPKLDTDKVDRVVRRLNDTRDIAVLLKGMRSLFVEELK